MSYLFTKINVRTILGTESQKKLEHFYEFIFLRSNRYRSAKYTRNMKRLTKPSRLFFITGLVVIAFSIFNKFFLKDKNFKDNFRSLNSNFHSSDLFLFIGLLCLFFAMLYLLTSKKCRIRLSEKLAMIHYILMTIFIFGLMFVPILDTIYGEGSIHDKSPILFNVVICCTFVGMLTIFISTITIIANILIFIKKIVREIFIKD